MSASFYAGEPVGEDRTVIFPCGSDLTAPLAVDLILHNRAARRVGHITHPALLPMAGAAPPAGGGTRAGEGADGGGDTAAALELVTAGDVYVVESDNCVVVQLRAPLTRAARGAFRDAAAAWIASLRPQRVVLLSGADATERVEAQLTGTQMRCVLSDGLRGAGSDAAAALAALGCPELEARPPTDACPDGVYVHRGGIARRLWQSCVDQGLDAAIVVHFVSPGDTRPEAHALTAATAGWLGWKGAPERWAEPAAWALTSAAPEPVRGLF